MIDLPGLTALHPERGRGPSTAHRLPGNPSRLPGHVPHVGEYRGQNAIGKSNLNGQVVHARMRKLFEGHYHSDESEVMLNKSQTRRTRRIRGAVSRQGAAVGRSRSLDTWGRLTMFTLGGPAYRYCDGVSRRSFLKVGGLAMGGLGLSQLMQAEAASGAGRSHKAVIMVYLSGGLSHQDTFDLKPNAPAEIRGEFSPIDTAVPGIQFGELLPRLAASADKLAVIRSIVGLRDEHSSWQNLTGYPMSQSGREGRPHFGAAVSKIQGVVNPVVPPFVDLFPTMQHRPYNSGGPGHLGVAYAGAKLGGEDASLMRQDDVEPPRFDQRRGLLDRFDGWRRDVETRRFRGWMRAIAERSMCWPVIPWRGARGGEGRPSAAGPIRNRVVEASWRRGANVE